MWLREKPANFFPCATVRDCEVWLLAPGHSLLSSSAALVHSSKLDQDTSRLAIWHWRGIYPSCPVYPTLQRYESILNKSFVKVLSSNELRYSNENKMGIKTHKKCFLKCRWVWSIFISSACQRERLHAIFHNLHVEMRCWLGSMSHFWKTLWNFSS